MAKEKEVTKELVKKEAVELTESTPMANWGYEDESDIDSSDILIPRIILMQPLSDFVSEKKASPGDLVRSTNREVLGNALDGIEVIPFKTFKTWVISEIVGGRREVRTIEPYTAANCNLPLEWSEGSKVFSRDRSLNFYVLLSEDIAREREALKNIAKGQLPDTNDCLVPCLFHVRRTSYPAGQTILDAFVKAKRFNVPPAVSTFKIYSEFQKTDKGNYFIYRAEKVANTKPEDVELAGKWYNILQKNTHKIDDSVDDNLDARNTVDLNNVQDNF